jgi:Fe-S-cluster containining protein
MPSAPGMPESESITARFTLKLEGRSLDFSVTVPSGSITLKQLLPALFEFNQQLLGHAVAREEKAGRAISCKAGCGACCRQLVPIGAVEAELVREWVDNRESAEREAIQARFVQAVESLTQAGVTDSLENRANLRSAEETRRLGLDYFKAGVPCPFLVEDSCSIYPVRPMKCREYLVTSPAANCADPNPSGIQMVGLPGSFLRVLLQLEMWLTGSSPRWLPLTYLYKEENAVRAEAVRPGPELFERFLVEFAGSYPS